MSMSRRIALGGLLVACVAAPLRADDWPTHALDWAEQGATVTLQSRQAFADFVKQEVERWTAIAKVTGIPME